MPIFIKNMIYNFAKDVQQLLGTDLSRVIVYGSYARGDYTENSDVDAIAYFNKTYVATDIFPRELGKRLGRIKMVREESDYSDFYVASEEDAVRQYETAEYI